MHFELGCILGEKQVKLKASYQLECISISLGNVRIGRHARKTDVMYNGKHVGYQDPPVCLSSCTSNEKLED
jgi:hypothetical protein